MARDFTVEVYKHLLSALRESEYTFMPYRDYAAKAQPPDHTVVLRHDVDARKLHSLHFAEIQHALGIKGTYYFRTVPQSYDETIMRKVADLGHEVGYHYETMDICRGDIDAAYNEFCRQLERFRKVVPVTTICMHGSPMSRFDNREIWKKYDYRSLGLIAEPYFDLDFNKTFYLTDTGRRWDGASMSVRDKAMSENSTTNPDFLALQYKTTYDIIKSARKRTLPRSLMMNFHPQRWTDSRPQWIQEWLVQSTKNKVKWLLIKLKS